MKDTATLLACLAVSLKLTDDTMRANASALPLYHRDADGPVKHTGQSGPTYVRVDAGFALEFAGPLLLQGAVTTCYCFTLYAVTSVMVTAVAYVYVLLKSAAMAAIALNSDPLKALDKLKVVTTDSKKNAFFDKAIQTVFQNTMASTGLIFQVAVAQAAVSAATMTAMAIFVLALKPKWAFVHKKQMYVDVRFLTQASSVTTFSAFPFVCAVLFSRTDVWARFKAAVWRYLQ
jgi:hypothetical protein